MRILPQDHISTRDFEAAAMNQDEMDKAQALTIQIFLLLGGAVISIAARLFIRCRQVGLKNLGLEDVFAVAGVVCSLCSFLPSMAVY
jgi:hypothetical protein